MTTLTLRFTFTEIKSSLERMGYVLKEETVILEGDFGMPDYKQLIWNAYLQGERVTGGAYYDYLYGADRVERLFEMELCKKLLELF